MTPRAPADYARRRRLILLNHAFWFAPHVIFDEVRVFEPAGLRLDVPVLARSTRRWALLSSGGARRVPPIAGLA
jgi:hypothetical protein